jgi:GNAT superfamily N-acetyltransferase
VATVVRRAISADWEQSRNIRLQALLDAPMAFASTHAREVGFGAAQWQERIAAAAQFLAEDQGEVVGTATGVVDACDPDTVNLVAMFVAPTRRGEGSGERLVRAVVEHARSIGALRVRLHVVESNVGAERLYTRVGFARTGAVVRLPHHPELVEHEMGLALVSAGP